MPARILIVEDTPHNFELMRYLLEARAHHIIGAASGAEGITRALEGNADLVILDLQLGDTTGFEVLKEIRNLPQMRSVPIVAVTAYAMVGDRDRILSAGFDGYLAKPLEPQVFAQQVESFLPPSLRGREHLRSHPGPREVGSQGSSSGPGDLPEMGAILVVDDRKQNIDLARGLLEPNGYEVLPASSVQEALTVLKTCRPRLVIFDIHLGGVNVLDALEHLQEDPRIADAPVLFHSATASPEDIRRIEDLGWRFLLRPVDPSVLLEAAQTIINGSDQSQIRKT